ncbi:MAG: tetratricopeptide repeat protein [Burkholderiales bacterium]
MSPAASIADELRAATELVYAGRFPQAESAARGVLARQPRNAEAHYVLALSAMFQKRHAEALAPIEKAISLAAGDAQYAFVRALCLAGAGRVEEALAAYRRALELRPAFFEAWANLGSLLETNGRFAEAEEAYLRADRLKPGIAAVLNGLGMCLLARGESAKAAEAFGRAVAADPKFATAQNNLGNTLGKLKQVDAAIGHLREAVRLRPDYAVAWVNLGEQCYVAGRDAEAVAAIDRALALDPANGGLRHLRDAIAGVQTGRAPDEYIRGFFDRFAADFDKRLVEDLEYRTPQRMMEFLAPWLAGREKSLRIEDLGCGTGLSGVELKPHASRLAGVDLSGKMLEKARERALYDELAEAEIAAYLDARPAGACDLAAAMDVFVYVGDLDAIFRAVARTLAPGGMFAFSVERLDGEGDFRLARSGRYSHSRAYLQALAKAHGLAEWRIAEADIRREAGKPVHGLLAGFTRA